MFERSLWCSLFSPSSYYIVWELLTVAVSKIIFTYTCIPKKKEGRKGGNKVEALIMKYLSGKGYLDGTTQFDLSIIMDNCLDQNKNNYVLLFSAYLTMNKYFETV